MSHAGDSSIWRPRGARWLGPAITILVALLAELLADTPLRVPNPPALLVLLIVYSAFQGGLTAGLVSAAVAWAYVAHFFSNPGDLFAYTDDNLRRVILWGVAMPAMAALVGHLQHRASRVGTVEASFEALKAEIAAREKTETALAGRARQQAVVAELGRLALAGGGLQELLDYAVAGVAESFGVEFCKVLELEPGGSTLRLVAGVGWRPGLIGQATVPAQRDSQAGFTLHRLEPVVTDDLRSETRFSGPPLLLDHGVVSGLSVIIGDHDRPFGVLGAHTTRRRAFTPDDVTLFQSVANVLAVAIQRQRAEAELRQAAAHLANVTAVSPAILYTLEYREGLPVTTWVGENVTSLAGYSVPEALQPGWWRTQLHPEDRDKALAVAAQLGLQGDRSSHEYRFLRKDGTAIWIRDERHLLRSEDGTPYEIVGAWMDVTERRGLEEQFLQVQKMETVGLLAGGVAHDFNNLLTVITSSVDLALPRLGDDDPLAADLREIRRAADRAAALTRQLLAFSRRQILRLEVLDLNASLIEMETMLPRVLGEDIALAVRRGRGVGNVRADPGQLSQIIMNLAVNGRDAMPGGGTLTFQTGTVTLEREDTREHPGVPPGEYATLTVTDTGIGMDDATRRRIFEPFFTTKALGLGTGLGLSTVYGIVTQTGGHIAVTSEPGKGTTFRLYFPRVAEPVAVPNPARAAAQARGTETILVVEDEAAVRRLVHRILSGAGYTVRVAETRGEALYAVEEGDGAVDLLLTDVVMPSVSGPDLAEELRGRRPELKVLYMSGYTEKLTVGQGTIGQGAPFIGKPFNTEELTRKVREVLDG